MQSSRLAHMTNLSLGVNFMRKKHQLREVVAGERREHRTIGPRDHGTTRPRECADPALKYRRTPLNGRRATTTSILIFGCSLEFGSWVLDLSAPPPLLRTNHP